MSESTAVVKIRCPACNKKLGFPQASAGRKARCPQCQETFRIEPPPPVPASKPALRPPGAADDSPLTVHCAACDKELRVPASAAGRTAKCPACGTRFTITAPAAAGPKADPPAATVPAKARTSSAAGGPEEEPGIFDLLAEAESKGQALAEQPAIPADFKPRELKPVEPEAQRESVPRSAARKTAPAAKDTASAMERAYSAMGTLTKGCLFSAAGALIGAFIWYGIAKAFDIELGYVAWGVGLLAGLGMHIGVQNESALAGVLAACFALGGIVAGKLMYVAWVFIPAMEADIQKERNSVEYQREFLVEPEAEKVLKTKNIDPDNADEEQDAAAYEEAEKRIAKLSAGEVRDRYQKYVQEHPEDESDLPSLSEVPTGILVVLFGLLFGFRGLIFVVLGMGTAFKVGYSGGSFGK